MKVADLHPAIPNKFTENSLITNAKMVLVMTQVFCMVPISGILSNDLQAISMPRFSIKIFLFIAVMASVLCMSAAYSVVFVRYDCRLRAAGVTAIFVFISVVIFICFRVCCILHGCSRAVYNIFKNSIEMEISGEELV